MDRDMIYYIKLSKEPSRHRIEMNLLNCCQADKAEDMNEKFIPLVVIDLSDLNTNLKGKFPIFYHEMTKIDRIISQLDDDDKVKECYLLDYEGKRFEFSEFETEDFFQDTIDVTKERLSGYSDMCLNIWPEVPAKALEQGKPLTSGELGDRVHQNSLVYSEKNKLSRIPTHRGPFPVEWQSDFAIPFDIETKEDFIFVGQLETDMFDLCDFKYFLFYNPKKKIIAQLMQMT